MAGPGLRFVAAPFFVLFLASPAFAQTVEYKRPNFALGLEGRFFHFDYLLNAGKFENVPLALRQVPSHPNDIWIYGSRPVMRTVPFDSINLGSDSNLVFSVAPEITVHRLRVRSGVSFTSISPITPDPYNNDSLREVNQYGRPTRGYGTSLVYWGIARKSTVKPGWISEADFEIGKGIAFIGGYSTNRYKLVFESGWDRWDRLEKYRIYDLSDNTVQKVYGGLGFQPGKVEGNPVRVSVLAGKAKVISDFTDLAEGMTVDYGSPWFFGLGFSVHGTFFKK